MSDEIVIKIDIKKISDELERRAIDKILNDYFDANDVEDWNRRKEERAKRLDKIIKKVDWEKLPEVMKNGILGEFVNKFISGRR